LLLELGRRIEVDLAGQGDYVRVVREHFGLDVEVHVSPWVGAEWSLTAWQQRRTCLLLRHEDLELLFHERGARVVGGERQELSVGDGRPFEGVRDLRSHRELADS